MPTPEEYKHIVKTINWHSIKSDSEIVSDYSTDINVFKSLLQQIYTDSMQLKIAWRKAKLKRVETKNFAIPIDSNHAQQSNRLTITEVKIIFTVDTLDYVLFLPSIWKYKHNWKLGNQILYGKADLKYGAEFTF